VRAYGLLLCVAFLSACGGAPAPPGPQPGPVMFVRTELPVHALVGQRQTLGLSSAQVTALDSIGHELDRRNAPLLQSLPRLGERSGRDRTPPDTATFARLRENRAEAAEAVRQVLTEEQRVRVCEIFGARSRDVRAAQVRRAQETRPRGTAAAAAGMAPRHVWPWCAPAAPPPEP
jgi:hypothetical protein